MSWMVMVFVFNMYTFAQQGFLSPGSIPPAEQHPVGGAGMPSNHSPQYQGGANPGNQQNPNVQIPPKYAPNSQGSPAASTNNQPMLNSNLTAQNKEDESLDPFDVGRRDPFKLPAYIIDKLKLRNAIGASAISQVVVEKDPLKRWPLEEYQLVGISWDVHSPKALIVDRDGEIHILTLKRRLGILGAILVRIDEGRVIFNEKGTIKTLNLKK